MIRTSVALSLLLFVAGWLVEAGPVAAQSSPSSQAPPPAYAPPPAVPPIAARAWLLLDYRTRHVIASQNADERMEPASLTKLMSAYLVFTALKRNQLSLSQTLPVSTRAWKMSGSRMFLEPDKPVTVDELLRGMIVQSGNDATMTLAEGVAGNEEAFVQKMNEQAARLGLANTRFANATGLPDPHHYSTAADLAQLALAVISDFPEYFSLYALKEYTYNRITQRNRNELLFRDPFVDGIKTGYTEAAGYCLIATAKRADRRLLAVVTGTASEGARAMEAQKLLNYGFQYYETLNLYPAGTAVVEIPVWKGSEKRLKAGFVQDFFVSVPKGQRSLLKIELESMQPLIAPISPQQPVGVLRVSYDGKPYGEFPVVALERVGVANMFVRAWDSLRLLFQ
ncbi:MAG TPA: D-alanyl-D-alanine carboxypeptidase family protein [Burkholderiales bacterium]|nr:D-alanyl-D-alanine carboxypeptidase family protein [Burkholderiales bacterium]